MPQESADLVARGQRLADEGRYHDAADVLLSALSDWPADGGEPLRWTARESLADVLLAIDEHDDAIAVLRAVIAEDPRRESLWTRLVTALHAAGRTPEALQAYHQAQQLLGAEFGTVREPASRNFLPLRPAELHGREAELHELERLAAEHQASGATAPLLVLVDGMPGAGKTAFGLEAAYRLAQRYPERQLYVDLRSHRHGLQRAADALHTLLDTVGGRPDEIAAGAEARAAQWRAQLAETRAVVVLDDVADAEQLRLLLPGRSPSVVLVLSRRRLAAPRGARRITLGPLPPADAVRMLTAGLELRPEERPDAADIAARCGHLPAALRMLNDRLRFRPGWSLYRLTYRMRDDEQVLGLLQADGHALADAFAASYDRLDTASQRLFRLVGSMPVSSLDLTSAAIVADVSAPDAERALDGLCSRHLLSQPTPGRYVVHPLLQRFARERVQADGGVHRAKAALGRLVLHYLKLATQAVAAAEGGSPAAADWLRVQHQDVLAATEVAPPSVRLQANRLRDLVTEHQRRHAQRLAAQVRRQLGQQLHHRRAAAQLLSSSYR